MPALHARAGILYQDVERAVVFSPFRVFVQKDPLGLSFRPMNT